MLTIRSTASAVALSLAFATTACGPRAAVDETAGVRLAVDNSRGPLGTVRVWLVPEGGVRRLVGTVGSTATDTLSISAPIRGGTYRLQAEPATGGRILSREFELIGRSPFIQWDLGANVVFISYAGS